MEESVSDPVKPSWEVELLKKILLGHAIGSLLLILSWDLWKLYQHLFG
jgi:hypothetical protein